MSVYRNLRKKNRWRNEVEYRNHLERYAKSHTKLNELLRLAEQNPSTNEQQCFLLNKDHYLSKMDYAPYVTITQIVYFNIMC